jgi:hypothetical protein
MKWDGTLLLVLALTVFEIVGYTQSTDDPKQKPPGATTSNNDNPALSVARVISIGPPSGIFTLRACRSAKYPSGES